MCIELKSNHDLTALADSVDYGSDFKLHKQQSVLLLKELALIMELSARSFMQKNGHFCLKSEELYDTSYTPLHSYVKLSIME